MKYGKWNENTSIVQGVSKWSTKSIWLWGPLKCSKSDFIPVHVFLHFGTLEVLQLILASKLSELEQFENWAENCQFANKIEFSRKWLHPRAKCKKGDPPFSLFSLLSGYLLPDFQIALTHSILKLKSISIPVK